MLSAFKPQSIIELKKQDKSKIEALLAYGDRLLVGLNTGVLRIYRLNEAAAEVPGSHNGTPSKTRTAELLREEEKFSKRPIQQLAVIKEANLLLALTDSFVSFYDLQTFEMSERLEQTKGASCFAVMSSILKDETTGIPSIQSKLAVAVKRKVLVWSWQDMELSTHLIDLTLPATVKSITWMSGSKLVAGMDPGYVIVDVETQELADVYRPLATGEAAGPDAAKFGAISSSGMSYMGMGSWIPKPLAAKIVEDQMLLSKDVNTLFIDQQGKPIQKRQIPWLIAPEAIGYSYPYLLSLQPSSKGMLEIRNPDTTSLLQSIELTNAGLLHVPQPNISLAHAGKGFLVASDRVVWRMGAFDYGSQVSQLLERKRFDEALSFVSLLEDTLLLDKEERLREIKMLKADNLFIVGRYRDSLDLYTEASAPPNRVISHYPALIAGTLSSLPEEDEDGEVPDDESDTKSVLSSSTHRKGEAIKSNKTPQTPRSKTLQPDNSSIKSHLRGASDVSEATDMDKKFEKKLSSEAGRDLVFAVNELCAFLAQTRKQIQKIINEDGSLKNPAVLDTQDDEPPSFHVFLPKSDTPKTRDWRADLLRVAILVDTTLFRAYMYFKPSLAASLFRIENFCAPEVVEDKLSEKGRYIDLIDFLHGKKLHKKALELLRKFGKSKEDDDIDEALRGPQRTIAYLQHLPFEEVSLILEYAEWPMKSRPEEAMQIFIADTKNAEELPRDQVLDFLVEINPVAASDYLEHIIEEWGDDTPEFHQRLIILYLDRLQSSDFRHVPARERVRAKLEAFLMQSTHYDRTATLARLPTNDATYYISRANVLSKLRRHREALSIYVFALESPSEAEAYCNRVFLAAPPPTPAARPEERDDPDAVYTTLLGLYLAPPAAEDGAARKPNEDAALDLLSRHGPRLPALRTLALLPHALPVRDLEAYFAARMRAATARAREASVVAALAGVRRNAAEARLLLGDAKSQGAGGGGGDAAQQQGRNRRVVVGEHRTCGVCGRRFNRQAIRVFPDGEVVHYGCGSGREGVESRRSFGVAGA